MDRIRTWSGHKPVAVEYSITPLGHTLQTPFSVLYAWSVEHSGDVLEA